MEPGDIEGAANLVRGAQRLLIITGAGVSADSGLPTYRGVGGLYNQGDTEEGVPIEEALSGGMLRQDPGLCWKYIHQIEQACRGASPNAAHVGIAELQEHHEVWVLTQNVDGLHAVAGSRNLLEIHGNVHRLLCTQCDWSEVVTDYTDIEIPPGCPVCSALVRPDVVLFGEMLPARVVRNLYSELERGFDLVMSIGTTSGFPYIAEPVVRASRAGRPSIEINPGDTMVSEIVSHRIRMGAAEAMTRIISAL